MISFMKVFILSFLSGHSFAGIALGPDDARNGFIPYLVKSGLYEGVVGANFKLKRCDTVAMNSGEHENNYFYIEFSQEKLNGSLATVAHAYYKNRQNEKVYCTDELKKVSFPAKGATRNPSEICKHLECALTHYVYPPIYDKDDLKELNAYCPSYKTILDHAENNSAVWQEMENIESLCKDSAETPIEVNVTDRDYDKSIQGHGANGSSSKGQKSYGY